MSFRILIIPAYRLFPIETGAGVAQYGIIDELRKQVEVSLLIDTSNVAEEHLEELEKRWPEVTFLQWTDLRVDWEKNFRPTMMQRLMYRLSPRRAVVMPRNIFIPESLRPVWKNCTILFYDTPPWRINSLKMHLSQSHYDIVQTGLPSNLPLIEERIPNALTVHVCHEWKHKRFLLTAEMLGVSASEYSPALEVLRKREVEMMEKYDHCIFFSDEDRDQLISDVVEGHVSPFPVLDDDFIEGDRGRPRRLIFIGPEHHGPNREAVDWLITELLSALPVDWRVRLIGKWSPEYRKSNDDERLIYDGFVSDLTPFFEQSIMIVPVRSGAGIRTKILQAMAAGVPVVSTDFAIEGIGAVDGTHFLSFSDSDSLAKAIAAFDENEFRQTMCQEARNLIKQRFSQAVLGQRRLSVLEAISAT